MKRKLLNFNSNHILRVIINNYTMLEQLQEFFTNNSTMVILAAVAIVALVAFVMFKRANAASDLGPPGTSVPGYGNINTPPHDLEGMENVNMVCDLANGVCHPQQMAQQEDMASAAAAGGADGADGAMHAEH